MQHRSLLLFSHHSPGLELFASIYITFYFLTGFWPYHLITPFSYVKLKIIFGSWGLSLLPFFLNLLIYLFLAVLGLRCCTRAFSSWGERGLLFVAMHGSLTAVASLVAEHGVSSTGSVAVAHRLSCSAACGIFLDQGSNLCPLHWQADS